MTRNSNRAGNTELHRRGRRGRKPGDSWAIQRCIHVEYGFIFVSLNDLWIMYSTVHPSRKECMWNRCRSSFTVAASTALRSSPAQTICSKEQGSTS